MAETIDTKLVNFFNSYLFRKVWNEPGKEYRRNIKPQVLAKPFANSSIKLEWKRYGLPTAEKYQVYYIPESTMSGITFRRYTDWINAVDFLNDSNIELRFHNTDGVMLPREHVNLVSHPEKPGVLIAIKRSIFTSILGSDIANMLVAFYYDSDEEHDITIDTYTLDGGTDINAVYAVAQTGTSVYVNGIATQVTDISDISIANAIVEIVTDANVLDEFEIDLADANERRNFISDIDNESKTIVHIPKSLNPDNKVITHNTCDIWIYPRNGATANRNGRFFHRAIEEYTFTQVTHNDFAIPDIIINSYSDVLNTDEFKLVVQLKNHEKDNVLITDKNYIGLLYSHADDNTILDFLEGVGPEDFDFWKAETLENSDYVKMMTDVPDFVDVINLPIYIGALGYYNSIALISNRIKRIELEDFGGSVSHRFITPIPIVFESIKVYPMVFVNGLKIDSNLVEVNKVRSGSVVIDVDESVALDINDDVYVELFEEIPHNIFEVRPTATYNHIGVENDNFVLYEVTDAPSAVPGIEQSYDKIYTRIDDISTVGSYVDSVGGRYVAFNSSAYNRIFIIANSKGFEYRSYNLDTMLSNNDPLAFDLSTTVKSIDFDPPYVWEDHTGISSASGDISDPLDPDAEDPYPAWHLLDGNTSWDLSGRWVTTLRPEGNKVDFELAEDNYDTYWLIGYRIGAMPNMHDALRASQMPINWQVRVDGNLVDAVSNEWWYLNPEVVHTHMLATPVLVSTNIEFLLMSVQTPGAFQIQTDLFEPIFSDSAESVNIPYLGNLSCIPYLNGKELVKNVDYHLADILADSMGTTPHLCGRQLVVTNAAYLKESGNKMELILTYNSVEGELQGFLEKSYLGEQNANPRWFEELSQVVVDGLIAENISTMFGTVQVPSPDVIDQQMSAWFTFDDDYSNKKSGDYTLTPSAGITLVDDVDGTYMNVPDGELASIVPSVATPNNFTFSTVLELLDDNPASFGPVLDMYLSSFVKYTLSTTAAGDWYSNILNGEDTSTIVGYETGKTHVAITVESGVNISVYINGVLVHTYTTLSALSVDQIQLKSSGTKGVKYYDVMVFHRVLSLPEIVQAGSVSDETRFRLGSPYGTRTLIPEKSRYFVNRHYSDDDTVKLDALTEYFRGNASNIDPVVLIPYSHRIVSIRAHIIIRDIINGVFVLNIDPDDSAVLAAISDYDYLKKYDILFDAETSVDLDFVDVQGMYTDQDIVDTNILLQIDRLLEVIIDDSVTHLRPNHES